MKRREFIAGLGGAAAWALAARAQQPALSKIGYLNAVSETQTRDLTAAFRQGLAEEGFIEKRNVEILYRWAESQYDRLPTLAADLVARRVSVIVATGGNVSALAARSATTTIPIVFTTAADPVELGLVESLSRPGGNATGAAYLTEEALTKRLELLHTIVPTATSIGFLANSTNPGVQTQLKQVEKAARVLGVQLVLFQVSAPSDIERAFAGLAAQRIGALQLGADPLFYLRRDLIAALAIRNAIPAISANYEFVEAGGLVSYGPRLSDAWRLAGTYTGRILKGEKPVDLPVQRSTRMQMVLNLITAKAIGLQIPPNILALADAVIE